MDVESLSSEIGKCLQWLRKSLLLTQYQLASFTELDYRHYQNIESGRVEVKVETLKRICSSFGIGLSTFFYLLDRRPWLGEPVTRSKANGDLYLYRLILEQAKFRLLPPVRDFVSEWGRAIAEGHRDTLKDCGRPCVEVDAEIRVLWKNTAAADLLLNGDRDITLLIAEERINGLQSALKEFWESKLNSFYYEVPVREDMTHHSKSMAFVGLKPMVTRPEQTIFMALVGVDDHVDTELESHKSLNLRDANRIFM